MRTARTRSVTAFVLLAITAGALPSDLRAADAPGVRGRIIAETYCARCHATGRDGASPHQDAPPMRELAGRWPIEHLAEALAEGIVVAHPDMPEFKFAVEDVSALLAFLGELRAAPRR